MRARTVLSAVLVTLTVAACGGDEEEAPTPAATATGSSASAPKNVKAAMKDFQFAPQEITVASGGKVTWTDEDSANHNVRFTGNGAPDGISNLREGKSASVTFDKPGTYAFVCTYHPNMKGTVDVR